MKSKIISNEFKLLGIFFLIFSLTLSAQNSKQVSGIVTDPDGLPLPGVTIIQKGTKNGTITNFDGAYSISVAKKDILIFSYIGMVTQEITVKEKTKIDIILNTDFQGLNEVKLGENSITLANTKNEQNNSSFCYQ